MSVAHEHDWDNYGEGIFQCMRCGIFEIMPGSAIAETLETMAETSIIDDAETRTRKRLSDEQSKARKS